MSTPDNQFVNFFSLFVWGIALLKDVAAEKTPYPVFVENRVIKMTRDPSAPPIAAFTSLADCPGRSVWPTVATALFALSLPTVAGRVLERHYLPQSPIAWQFAVNRVRQVLHLLKASLINRY